MRIPYGLAGEGMGHAIRSKRVLARRGLTPSPTRELVHGRIPRADHCTLSP